MEACNDGTAMTEIPMENSDVLLFGSVAVAVTTQPAGTETGSETTKFDEHDNIPKVKLVCPRKTCPSA